MKQNLADEISEQLEQDAALGAKLDGLSYIDQRPLIRAANAQRFADLELLTARTHVEEHEIDVPDETVRLHIYTPLAARTRGAFFHIHGGGFTLGSIDDPFTVAKCAHICAEVGCTVATVDYRLAPEFPYPTALEDCYAALCWVVEHATTLGIDESRVVVGGESAGGNLAAAVALLARDRGGPPLVFQLLEVPVVDMSSDSKARRSLDEFGQGYGLDATVIAAFETAYLSDERARREAYASPLCAPDLRGLPPARVLTAEFDPLRDSGEAYARRLYEAGVPTTIHRFLGHTHGSAGLWLTWAPAAQWMAEIVTTLEAATSAQPQPHTYSSSSGADRR